jgi:mannose-1-phosphate guanylyltransferase/mannose-6-phosphate isomerase
MAKQSKVIALLLSGGAGTRLWPVSRAECPKQFLKLFGEHSLYQLTLMRLRSAGVDDVIVAANRDHRQLLSEQAAEIGQAQPLLMLEPARRDSGPAIAAGVALARQHFGEESIVCAMPCDHLIPETEAFSTTLKSAVQLARSGYLGTFGITPTSPSTEFGYLQRGDRISGQGDAYKVDTFHEKPKQELAVQYLASGNFSWNSGMFVFSTRLFAQEAALHMPLIWSAVEAAVAEASMEGQIVALAEAPFLASPRMSIDYALFEHSSKVAMVRADFAWSDVGNWHSVFASLDKNTQGNAFVGDVRSKDITNTLIVAEGIPVVAIGVDNLVIIARPDGVLVSRPETVSQVKDFTGG